MRKIILLGKNVAVCKLTAFVGDETLGEKQTARTPCSRAKKCKTSPMQFFRNWCGAGFEEAVKLGPPPTYFFRTPSFFHWIPNKIPMHQDEGFVKGGGRKHFSWTQTYRWVPVNPNEDYPNPG